MCNYEPYTLPEISFIGGSTQEFVFDNFFDENGEPFDLTDCTANFAIVCYANRSGAPIVSEPMKVLPVNEGETPNTLYVALSPGKTINCSPGKYVYQVTIRDISGECEQMQGIIYIYKNINPDFIG